MITQSTLCRPEAEMVLHPITCVNFRAAVVTMDGQRDHHGALGIFHPVAIRPGHLEVVRHQIELLASHVECWVIVDLH